MSRKIRIMTQRVGTVEAELLEKNPITAGLVWEGLPFKARASRWGDEVYFKIPVKAKRENQQQYVDVGDIGYWVEGQSMAIFFGRTPASEDERPKAYVPINVFAKVVGDPKAFRKVKDGDLIRVEKA